MGATVKLTREQVAARILKGEHIVIYNQQAIRVPDSWLEIHPGGFLTILHFIGRDATDEIQAYHDDATLRRLQKFAIGTVEGLWEPLQPPIMTGWRRRVVDGKREWVNEAAALTPKEDTELAPSSQVLLVDKQQGVPELPNLIPPPSSLDPEQEARHSAAFKVLHQRVKDAGLYKTPFVTGYGPEIARYLLFSGLSAYAYFNNYLFVSAVFLGMFWHQLVFTCHDLGHRGVTANVLWDRIISVFLADFVGGLSIGWWVDSHNVHHLVTNHPSHDPDIQLLPFFAVTPDMIHSVWSTYYQRLIEYDAFAKLAVQVQHKIFYIILGLARFNLYANSYGFLFRSIFDRALSKGTRWSFRMELVGLVFFWTWFVALLYGCGSWTMAFMYVMVSHIVTSPLHVQIVLSHYSMSTADMGPTESFPRRQMRTTTDVKCPPSLQFLHGGLHLQVTHHLFPRLPRHNLRAASALVKEFAKEQGLTYNEFGFVDGNKEVVNHLRGVAEQIAILGRVAEAEVQEKMDQHKVKVL
ncbi:delta 8-sphingoloid desaturase protein [Athelia psychrophila]|uniref:Delta 8-(E)-sphingolipid desaturase n=1 Tax=Athelia psychrophila TaxID=1759441 RepID=A0A166FGZ1_9AGAM|nr:delta 8-sphingoloid desaturase protein [Fibularhizoctonia sp. CBS 109695]